MISSQGRKFNYTRNDPLSTQGHLHRFQVLGHRHIFWAGGHHSTYCPGPKAPDRCKEKPLVGPNFSLCFIIGSSCLQQVGWGGVDGEGRVVRWTECNKVDLFFLTSCLATLKPYFPSPSTSLILWQSLQHLDYWPTGSPKLWTWESVMDNFFFPSAT